MKVCAHTAHADAIIALQARNPVLGVVLNAMLQANGALGLNIDCPGRALVFRLDHVFLLKTINIMKVPPLQIPIDCFY